MGLVAGHALLAGLLPGGSLQQEFTDLARAEVGGQVVKGAVFMAAGAGAVGLPQVVKRSTKEARSRSGGRPAWRSSAALRLRNASVDVRPNGYILATYKPKIAETRRRASKKESAGKANLLKNPQPSRLHAYFAEPLMPHGVWLLVFGSKF